MAASRLIILGVAVAAAGGAGYVAKNMMARRRRLKSSSNPAPQAPAIALQDVLVLSGDVPMGSSARRSTQLAVLAGRWHQREFHHPRRRARALEKLKGGVARVAMYAGEPLRRSKLIGEGQSFMSSILPSGMRAVATPISADTSAGGFILPNDLSTSS